MQDTDRDLLPEGLEDRLPQDAAAAARLTRSVLDVLDSHGYDRVQTPTIEFEGSLASRMAGVQLRRMFRFVDPASLRTLALRSDIPPQVGRIARNALARAVFFNRLGEIRDRSFEQQRYRASGLNLVTAAIVLWNTVYLERAANALRGHAQAVDDGLLQYLSPPGREHIKLTGDYPWRSSAKLGAGKFRPLRPLSPT